LNEELSVIWRISAHKPCRCLRVSWGLVLFQKEHMGFNSHTACILKSKIFLEWVSPLVGKRNVTQSGMSSDLYLLVCYRGGGGPNACYFPSLKNRCKYWYTCLIWLTQCSGVFRKLIIAWPSINSSPFMSTNLITLFPSTDCGPRHKNQIRCQMPILHCRLGVGLEVYTGSRDLCVRWRGRREMWWLMTRSWWRKGVGDKRTKDGEQGGKEGLPPAQII
jgi:hypothetical protein